MTLDLGLRLRVELLDRWVSTHLRAGVVDVTPGVRSLLVQVDGDVLTVEAAAAAAAGGRVRPGRRRARRAAVAGRPPPAVVGRSLDAGRHRPVHEGRPRRRAVVPVEHRVHPPDQRPRQRRGRAADRVRRVVPRARAGRRVPRRTGGHAARPPAPAGDDEVQPGPHVDAGERGRHRRRLPVHLRHGGSGRVPVRRADRAGVEPRPAGRALRPALAAAVVRPAAVPPGQRRRAAGPARGAAGGHAGPATSRRPRSRWPTTGPSSPSTPRRSRSSAPRQRAAFAAERRAWAADGESGTAP